MDSQVIDIETGTRSVLDENGKQVAVLCAAVRRKPRVDPTLRNFVVAILLVLLCFFASGFLSAVRAQTIGLHGISVHHPSKAYQNNENWGAYYRTASGFQVGAYHNTIDRTTIYVGQQWDWAYGFGAQIAAGTGYQKKIEEVQPSGTTPGTCKDGGLPPCYATRGHSRGAVAVMAALTWATPPVEGIRARFTLMPGFLAKTSSVLHLSLEYQL